MKDDLHARLRSGAAALGDQAVTLEQLVRIQGPAAPGSLLVMLAAPCALPVPGVGNILGTTMILLALSLWRGRPWGSLPQRVGDLKLSARWARSVLLMLARFYGLASRWSHPRWCHLAVARTRSWMAIQLALMGAVIFLPVPFGNILPALAVVLLGMGLAFRDGLAVLASAGMAAVAIGYSLAVGMGAWIWIAVPLKAWLGSFAP